MSVLCREAACSRVPLSCSWAGLACSSTKYVPPQQMSHLTPVSLYSSPVPQNTQVSSTPSVGTLASAPCHNIGWRSSPEPRRAQYGCLQVPRLSRRTAGLLSFRCRTSRLGPGQVLLAQLTQGQGLCIWLKTSLRCSFQSIFLKLSVWVKQGRLDGPKLTWYGAGPKGPP